MGNGLVEFFKNRVKGNYKLAFISTFVIALLTHLYKFTNTLLNHDSVYNFYSDQNVLGSGRWALSAACSIGSYYDLPWVNGILSAVFIALTAVVITAVFELDNPVITVLSGALLAVSPSMTETFFFEYTADGYMIAMFLAALSVYFSKVGDNKVSHLILSVVCICVSCGIYQAYVSFALMLAVIYFMYILLTENCEKSECLKWVFKCAVTYILSLAVYYAVWKILLKLTGTSVNDYQGIAEVGKINLGLLFSGIKMSIKSVLLYFLQWNVLEHGFPLYSILSIIFLISFAVGICVASYKSKIYRRKWALVLFILCLAAVIPFAEMWNFASKGVTYSARMLQSLTLLFIFNALIYEKYFGIYIKNAVCILLILTCGNNALMANISYFMLNACYEKSYAEGLEMMIKIHELECEYEFDKIAVVGSRRDKAEVEFIDQNGYMLPDGKIHILSSGLERTLMFDHDHTSRFLCGVFGLELTSVTPETRNKLANSDIVKAMDSYPHGEYMAVADDILIIKLSD